MLTLYEVLDKPIKLQGVVAYQKPMRIDGVCSLGGSLVFYVVNCDRNIGYEYGSTNLAEAIKYVNSYFGEVGV